MFFSPIMDSNTLTKKYSFFLLIVLLIASCENKKALKGNEIVEFDGSVKAIDIMDSLTIPIDLYKVNTIGSTNNFLFALSVSSDTLIKVFKLPEYTYLGAFGKQGPGPEEFNNLVPSSFTGYNDQLVVTDLKSVRFFELDISESKKELVFRKIRQERIIGSYIPLNMAFILNDSTIGGQVDGAQLQYSIFNTRTESSWEIAPYPELRDNIPQTANYHLYQFWNALKPDQKSIVSAYVNFPALKIDRIDTGEDILIEVTPKNPQNQTIEIGAGDRSVNSFALFKYFNAVEANNEFIVGRYQEGKVLKKFIDGTDKYQWKFEGLTNPYFLIFNWNGDPIKRIELEEWMIESPYTITPNNEIVFLHPEKERSMYTISLNKIL